MLLCHQRHLDVHTVTRNPLFAFCRLQLFLITVVLLEQQKMEEDRAQAEETSKDEQLTDFGRLYVELTSLEKELRKNLVAFRDAYAGDSFDDINFSFACVEARFKRYEGVVDSCKIVGNIRELKEVIGRYDCMLTDYLQAKYRWEKCKDECRKERRQVTTTNFTEALPRIRIRKFKGSPYEWES